MAYSFSESLSPDHKLTLDNRGKLTVTGVEDVESFDEQTVVLVTVKGLLIVRGINLHLQSLSLDGGGVTIDGTVDSMSYEQKQTGGWLARLLH